MSKHKIEEHVNNPEVAEIEQALDVGDFDTGRDTVEAEAEAAAKKNAIYAPLPAARPGGAPPWVKIPEGFKFPRGRQVAFIRFRAAWTDTPDKGERQCILWALTDADEKVALSRAMGDVNRAANELAKQMVRGIDGYVADWSGNEGSGNIDRWWTEIGGRCRGMLVRIFTQLHVLNDEERKDFFESCIVLRTAG